MPSNDSKATIAQFLKFNMVGLLNTAIDFAVFAVLIWTGLYYVIAQLLSYAAGMLNSYIWNSRFTFGDTRRRHDSKADLGRMVRFAVWNAIMLGLSILLLAAFAELTAIGEIYAKAVVTVIIVAINFYGSKRFVFKSAQLEANK